jgi:hypothetical protein
VTKFLSYMQNFWSTRHLAPVTASADAQARGVLKEAADRKNWGIQFTNTCEEAWMIANQLTAPVILRMARGRADPCRPTSSPHRYPLSKVADEYLWSERQGVGVVICGM